MLKCQFFFVTLHRENVYFAVVRIVLRPRGMLCLTLNPLPYERAIKSPVYVAGDLPLS